MPAVAPAVLVVADQLPLRVGRERRLARARKTEEDRDVALVADIRRAVHREHSLERQPVVHQREDRLLDLTRVEGAADQHLESRRVQHDERAGARPVLDRVGLQAGGVQDDRLWLEVLQLLVRGCDEHRPREQRVVRAVGDDADRDSVLGVGAGEGVDDVQVALGAEVCGHLGPERVVAVLLEHLVHLAPPDAVLRAALARDELVPGRAAGVPAGVDDERPAVGEHAFVAAQCVGVKDGRRRVPPDRALRLETVGDSALICLFRHAPNRTEAAHTLRQEGSGAGLCPVPPTQASR